MNKQNILLNKTKEKFISAELNINNEVNVTHSDSVSEETAEKFGDLCAGLLMALNDNDVECRYENDKDNKGCRDCEDCPVIKDIEEKGYFNDE